MSHGDGALLTTQSTTKVQSWQLIYARVNGARTFVRGNTQVQTLRLGHTDMPQFVRRPKAAKLRHAMR